MCSSKLLQKVYRDTVGRRRRKEEEEELRGEKRTGGGEELAGSRSNYLLAAASPSGSIEAEPTGGGGNPNFKWGLVSLPHPPIVAQITPSLLQPRGCPDIDLEPWLALAPPPFRCSCRCSPLSFVPIGHAEKLYPSSSSSCGPPGPLWLLPFCCYCRSCHTSISCSCLLSHKENNMRCFNTTLISSS